MGSISSSISILALILIGISFVQSSIYRFDSLNIGLNQLDTYTNGMFSYKDAPFKGEEPKIHLRLYFEQKSGKEDQPTKMQVVLLHSEVNDYVGKEIDGKNFVCCWQEQYDAKQCDVLGELIIQQEAFDSQYDETFFLWEVGWEAINGSSNSSSDDSRPLNLKVEQDIRVGKSGVWIFAMVHCGIDDSKEGVPITVNGLVSFQNAYGQLPGDILGLMPIYLLCFVSFLGGIMWWTILAVRYGENLLFVQKCIGVVMAAGCIENILYFLDYLVYNSTGEISLTFNVFSVFALVFKRTICYVALILICSGYTIIHETMTKKFKFGMIFLGIGYAIVCWIYEFVRMLRYTPATQYLRVSAGGEYFMLAIISVFDFCILLWIFFSLFRTYNYLLKNKLEAKLKQFKKLVFVLTGAYLVSLIFFIIEAYASFGNKYLSWWKGWWVWDGYWAMLYLSLILIIAFLWRPTGNNSKYFYESQLDDEVELPATDINEIQPRLSVKDDKEIESKQ